MLAFQVCGVPGERLKRNDRGLKMCDGRNSREIGRLLRMLDGSVGVFPASSLIRLLVGSSRTMRISKALGQWSSRRIPRGQGRSHLLILARRGRTLFDHGLGRQAGHAGSIPAHRGPGPLRQAPAWDCLPRCQGRPIDRLEAMCPIISRTRGLGFPCVGSFVCLPG